MPLVWSRWSFECLATVRIALHSFSPLRMPRTHLPSGAVRSARHGSTGELDGFPADRSLCFSILFFVFTLFCSQQMGAVLAVSRASVVIGPNLHKELTEKAPKVRFSWGVTFIFFIFYFLLLLFLFLFFIFYYIFYLNFIFERLPFSVCLTSCLTSSYRRLPQDEPAAEDFEFLFSETVEPPRPPVETEVRRAGCMFRRCGSHSSLLRPVHLLVSQRTAPALDVSQAQALEAALLHHDHELEQLTRAFGQLTGMDGCVGAAY